MPLANAGDNVQLVKLKLFNVLTVSFSLVTVIVYVLVVLSPAVTTTSILFAPTTNSLFPVPVTVASLLFTVAPIVIVDTLYGTLTVYSVLLLTNSGVNVPLDTVKLFNVLSLLAFLVTVIVYVLASLF